MGIESILGCNLKILRTCQNRTNIKIVIQDLTVPHDFLSLARKASAAPAASFKRAYRRSG